MEHLKDWGPGFRFFECDECGFKWRDACRDWTSPSSDPCPSCRESGDLRRLGIGSYIGGEPHYDWPTDGHGNLLEDVNYETQENQK